MAMDYGAFGVLGGMALPLIMDFLKNRATPATNTDRGNPGNVTDEGIRNPWSMAKIGGGLSPNGWPLSTPQGQADQQKFGNPNQGSTDYGKGVETDITRMWQDAGNTVPDPNKTGQANPYAAMQNALGGQGQKSSIDSRPYTLGGSAMALPNYAGTGPKEIGAGGITPQMLAMLMPLPNGAQGSPLGMAASNPLLALALRKSVV